MAGLGLREYGFPDSVGEATGAPRIGLCSSLFFAPVCCAGSTPPMSLKQGWTQDIRPSKGSLFDASVLAGAFVDFIFKHNLSARLSGCSLVQVRALCLWLQYISPTLAVKDTPWKRFTMPLGKYVPKEAVVSPAVPYFLRDAEDPLALPVATAPRV